MRDARERTFFWLGVLVFPIFWSWFTLAPRFSPAQRFLAFSWLGLTAAIAYACRQALSEHLFYASLGYPIIAGWLTVALVGWLFYRTSASSTPTLFEIVVFLLIFGPYIRYFMDSFVHIVGQPSAIHTLMLPLVLSVTHLLLDPLTRARQRVFRHFGYEVS